MYKHWIWCIHITLIYCFIGIDLSLDPSFWVQILHFGAVNELAQLNSVSQTWLKVGLQTGLVPRPQVGTCMDLESDSISYQIQKQIRDLDPIFIDTRNQVSNSNYFQVGDAGLSDNRISICNPNVSLSLAKFNRYHSYQHHH